jgi:hypothetical protein
MKQLLAGIVLIIVIGFGGFIYRNAIEHSPQAVGCTLEAKVCPDGSAVGRSGPTCAFAECLPPNVSFAALHIAFAVPAGFIATGLPDDASVAAYKKAATTTIALVTLRRYTIASSSNALATIQTTAIGGASGEPVSTASYSSIMVGPYRFTTIPIERFEGVIDTAYYLARDQDVLRFDAIDQGVINWTDPSLDIGSLPGAMALRELLSTLQVGN